MRRNFIMTLFSLFVASYCCLAAAGCATSTPASPSLSGDRPDTKISARSPIILVCAFDVIKTDEETVCPALALAPILRRDLFCVQQISVIPTEDTRTPRKSYFYKKDGLEKLARVYGADIVTVGMLSRDSEEMSIEFRAYDFAEDRLIIKTTVKAETNKFFKLEKKLVFQFLDALGIYPDDAERQRILSCPPRTFKAAEEFGRGLKEEREERFSEALIAYRNATGADRCFVMPYAGEARIFRRYGAPSKIKESFENAVGSDEFFAEGWYQLNLHAARHLNKNDMAIDYCEKALEIAPRFGKARLSLGTRLYSKGDLNGAIEELKKAIELLPANPLPRYNLGACYRDSNQPEEARKWFKQALELDPGFIYAQSELDKLEKK